MPEGKGYWGMDGTPEYQEKYIPVTNVRLVADITHADGTQETYVRVYCTSDANVNNRVLAKRVKPGRYWYTYMGRTKWTRYIPGVETKLPNGKMVPATIPWPKSSKLPPSSIKSTPAGEADTPSKVVGKYTFRPTLFTSPLPPNVEFELFNQHSQKARKQKWLGYQAEETARLEKVNANRAIYPPKVLAIKEANKAARKEKRALGRTQKLTPEIMDVLASRIREVRAM